MPEPQQHIKNKNHQKNRILNIIIQANRNNNMTVRELVNDLSLFESKIKSLRLILNLPLTQNRNLTVTEKEKVYTILNEIKALIDKHLVEME